MFRNRSDSYEGFASGSGFDEDEGAVGATAKRPSIDPLDRGELFSRAEEFRRRRAERLIDSDTSKKPATQPPQTEPTDNKRPRLEGMPSDVNLNVTFKRAKPEVDHHLDGKDIKYVITKHIDDNRDLYFIKLVSGALKRKSFHSLIKVEEEEINDSNRNVFMNDFDVKIKYSYNEQLLYAWATVLDKIKDMIDPSIKLMDRTWDDSRVLYERILKNDSVLLAFARYVAFIMMSESNNMIPRNKTRYVIDDQSRIEDERVLALMRALKNGMQILDPKLAELYM